MNFPQDFKGVYTHLIVHCTATPASMDIGAAEVDRMHRKRGWSRCGYHAVIRRNGVVEWEGTGHRTRPIGKPGAHVGGCGPGWNERSLGVSLVGGVKDDGKTPENNFTEAQLEALREFIEAATDALGIDKAFVMGHRDLIKQTNAAPKACPCFSVIEWMDGWEQAGELTMYDRVRDAFNWKRKLRPAVPRGEALKVPRTYTVQQGDTLFGLSRATGVRLSDIERLNTLDGSTIYPGQKLRLL